MRELTPASFSSQVFKFAEFKKKCEISHLCVGLALVHRSGMMGQTARKRKMRDFLEAQFAGSSSNLLGRFWGRFRRCSAKTADGTFSDARGDRSQFRTYTSD